MKRIVNIIGAGKLGKTIGHLLVKHQIVTIGAICNKSAISAKNAVQFIGQGKDYSSIIELPPADITFITTPDDLISATAEQLSKNALIKKGSIILHCSGSLSSDVLRSMRSKECYIASVHPMKSFAKPELSIELYSGTYCAIEGDKDVLPEIHYLFNSIGSKTYEIDSMQKLSYHTAGVFASNYLVTLAQQALGCMTKAGIENNLAMSVITDIMQGTVSNLEHTLSPKQSLTGPIKRGDIATIIKHIESLTDIEQKDLYKVLGLATLDLTDHNTVKKEQLTHALHSMTGMT